MQCSPQQNQSHTNRKKLEETAQAISAHNQYFNKTQTENALTEYEKKQKNILSPDRHDKTRGINLGGKVHASLNKLQPFHIDTR